MGLVEARMLFPRWYVLLAALTRYLSATTTWHSNLIRKEAVAHHDLEALAKHSAAGAPQLNQDFPFRDPPSTMYWSEKILCELEDVRVADNSNGWRTLQFRNSDGLWKQHEGKMKCNEDAKSCSHLDTNGVPLASPPSSAAECSSCPCTPMLPIEAYWANYQNAFLTPLREHCKGHTGYNVAVVGMGTGGAVQAIVNNCEVGTVSVVEKNAQVLDVAKHYFGFHAMTEERGVQVLVPYDGTDGLVKLLHDHGRHTVDAIVIDCMVQGKIPNGCKSAEFYQAIAQNLKPGGHVFQWTWPEDQDTAKTHLSKSLGSDVKMTHWWATGQESEIPQSFVMLSGRALVSSS